MPPSSYSEGPHLPKWVQVLIALATALVLVWAVRSLTG